MAGGNSRRMGGDTPKQFLPLGSGEGSKPVIVHTVERFLTALPQGSPIVVVIAESEAERWRQIAQQHGLWERVRTCTGGATRAESVRHGLAQFTECDAECDVVAIHDAVRPLVSAVFIGRLFEAAEAHGSAVPYVRPVDSMRLDGEACDRSRLMAVQTPQIFSYDAIMHAYSMLATDDAATPAELTDDASIVEHALDVRIHLCEGEHQNIKITTPLDLVIANALIEAGY